MAARVDFLDKQGSVLLYSIVKKYRITRYKSVKDNLKIC
jgi:hypothetical protein